MTGPLSPRLSVPDAPPQTWTVSKPQVAATGGLIVAQHPEAARAGARVLAAGGTAMDAAVVAAAVLSVVEPWLSGLGGGGFLLHATPDGAVTTLDFNVIAGQGVRPADYPLAGGAGGDWFDWPAVAGDRNLTGPGSICVPGAVDGLSRGLSRFGTLSWAEALAPATALAERGLHEDWFSDLALAVDRAGLARDPAAAALFLDPAARRRSAGGDSYLPMPAKARMLRRLAQAGPRDFYEGQIARDLSADLAAMGAPVGAADLAGYRACWGAPVRLAYRDRLIHTMGGLSGGPSLLAALADLAPHPLATLPEPERAALMADAMRRVYERRLRRMGHAAGPGDCTSHISVIDGRGAMVSLTNTLLSRFGAKVLAPSCGMLLNNGMMWFDPRPGQPNALAPGVRPLANMSPVIATRAGRPEIALGAAGGRQIFPAVLQILSALIDRGMSPEAALHAPRLDASMPVIQVDRRAPPDVATAIAARHPVQIVDQAVYPVRFAIPSLVVAGLGTGPDIGAAHPFSPWAAACAAHPPSGAPTGAGP